MFRPHSLLLVVLACGLLPAEDPAVVFRSDVSLVRVDAQVVDGANRAITGLRAEDFVLRESGRPQEIRNFVRESMPVDIVLLLDVSGSMRPHVQTIAEASYQALSVLGRSDRVAIMVFDRATRLRSPFRNSRGDISWELDNLLRQETFNGGTDITRGMLDAIEYVGRQGRPDARRAIVILTDDETERERDEATVMNALMRYDVVMSSLLAPSMYTQYPQMPGGGNWPQGPGAGGSWPNSGGSWPNSRDRSRNPQTGSWPPGAGTGGSSWPNSRGGQGGGVILGRRGTYGSGRPSGGAPRTQSAGTASISHNSGGDTMGVDDAYALQTTLERIRQRYALHFNQPDGVGPGQQRTIDVALAGAARSRYPGAEVRFRRVYLTSSGAMPSSPAVTAVDPARDDSSDQRTVYRRRASVADTDHLRGPIQTTDDTAGNLPPPAACPDSAVSTDSGGGGWRRVGDPAPQRDDSYDRTDNRRPRLKRK